MQGAMRSLACETVMGVTGTDLHTRLPKGMAVQPGLAAGPDGRGASARRAACRVGLERQLAALAEARRATGLLARLLTPITV